MRIGELLYAPDGKLLRDSAGEDVFLRPKTLDVLDFLVAQDGRLASRDAIIDHAWPDIVVSDDSLTQCISEIRRAIGVQAKSTLKTIPKRGYQLKIVVDSRNDFGTDAPDAMESAGNPVGFDGRQPGPVRLEAGNAAGNSAAADPLALHSGGGHGDFVGEGTAPQAEAANVPARDMGRPQEPRLSFSATLVSSEQSAATLVHVGHGDPDRLNSLLMRAGLRPLDRFTTGQGAGRGAGLGLLFGDPATALDCARTVALAEGLPVAIACGPDALAQGVTITGRARSGEVLVSLEVRDRLSSAPRVRFEDIGEALGAVQPLRAFRAIEAPTRGVLLDPDRVLPTLAILPLRNGMEGTSAGTQGAVFSGAVTQELSRSHEVNVISSLSTASFARRDLGLADARNELRADFVLSGFWVVMGNQMQVSCEFADTRSERVLWSENITLPADAPMAFLDKAHQVSNQIRRAIVVNETRKVMIQPFETLEAYSLLFGAVGLMHRLAPSDFARSRELLGYLLEQVNDHPTPMAWMARWHLLRVVQGWSDDVARDGEHAYARTSRALDIDPNHTLALVSQGQVLTHLKGRLDEAEQRYDMALEANPNDAQGHAHRAMLLGFTDRGQEGLAHAERALHLSPLDPHRFMNLALAAGVHLSAGEDEKALKLTRESYRLNRTHMSTLRMLAVVEARCGNMDQARKAAEEMMRGQPGFRVGDWLRASPSADFLNGRRFASELRALGVPE